MNDIEQNQLIMYTKNMSYEIIIYATETGKEPFQDWLKSLYDLETQALIFQRLQRIKLGNFGDCKSLDDGLWEFRIHHKAGLRVYYTRIGRLLILILGGGDKGSQRKDINQAKKHLKDYRRRVQ